MSPMQARSMPPEDHELIIDCYGNRFNTFGQLHNVDSLHHWWGPESWRTTGDGWSDAWYLKPHGIEVAPRVLADDQSSSR